MVDPLKDRYQDLLDGSYDCVDRIVLNAYFPLGHNPGGFRVGWRRLFGSEDHLDNTHLKRMAGRFSRRLYACAKKRHLPVVRCAPGERKHEIAEEYLTTHGRLSGVVSDHGLACSGAGVENSPLSRRQGEGHRAPEVDALRQPLCLSHLGWGVGTYHD